MNIFHKEHFQPNCKLEKINKYFATKTYCQRLTAAFLSEDSRLSNLFYVNLLNGPAKLQHRGRRYRKLTDTDFHIKFG